MNRALLILINSILLLFSCNRETLRFFFDGVDQTQPETSFTRGPQMISAKDTLKARRPQLTDTTMQAKFMHPDYQKRACSKCHEVDHAYRLSKRQPDLCYQCHKPYNEKYEVLHGPVAAGFCTACHLPHQSQNKHLLKMPVREVCNYCHHPGDVSKNQAHSQINTIECVQCHNSHGGKTLNLLKDTVN